MHSKHIHILSPSATTATENNDTNTPTSTNIATSQYTVSNNNSPQPIIQNNNQIAMNHREVQLFLSQCGLSQYYNIFIEEGFDRTESLLEITETDLIQMQVKRGHRRLLQRAIANAKGIPSTVPLQITPVLGTKELAGECHAYQLQVHCPIVSTTNTIAGHGSAIPMSSTTTITNATPELLSTPPLPLPKPPQPPPLSLNNTSTSTTTTASSSSSNNNSSTSYRHTSPMLLSNPSSSSASSNAPSTPTSLTPPNKIVAIMSIRKNSLYNNNSNSRSNNNNNDNNNNNSNDTIISPDTTTTAVVTSSSSSNSQHHQAHPSNDYFPSAGTTTTQSGMSSTEEEAVTSDNVHRLWKRKYHRHAKPDTNAPLKPPSAYVMFSNDVRAELKQQNKSFTDLAKIIGDRWKNISSENKELYESNAFRAREEYLKKVEEYQKTDSYKKYQKYLSDFKAENEAAARPVGRPRKRHRRDEEKELSDGTTSDSTRQNRRTSSISSQPEDRHQRTLSLSSDLRHYPFYLLNEDSAGSSSPTPPANNNQVQSDTLTDRPPNLKKSPKRHTPKK